MYICCLHVTRIYQLNQTHFVLGIHQKAVSNLRHTTWESERGNIWYLVKVSLSRYLSHFIFHQLVRYTFDNAEHGGWTIIKHVEKFYNISNLFIHSLRSSYHLAHILCFARQLHHTDMQFFNFVWMRFVFYAKTLNCNSKTFSDTTYR